MDILPTEITALILQCTRDPLLCASICRQWRELCLSVARSECVVLVTAALRSHDELYIHVFGMPIYSATPSARRTRPLVFVRYLILRADTLEDCRLAASVIERACNLQRYTRIVAPVALWRFLELAQPAVIRFCDPAVGGQPQAANLQLRIGASDAELLIGAAIVINSCSLLSAIASKRAATTPLCSTELLCRAVCYGLCVNNMCVDTGNTAVALHGLLAEIFLRHDLAAVPWDLRACVRYALQFEYVDMPQWTDKLIPHFEEIEPANFGRWLSALPLDVLSENEYHSTSTSIALARAERCKLAVEAACERFVCVRPPAVQQVPAVSPSPAVSRRNRWAPILPSVLKNPTGNGAKNRLALVISYAMRDYDLISNTMLYRIEHSGRTDVRVLTFTEFDGELHFIV